MKTLDYSIKYYTENSYENPVTEAFWQYLVTPETNENQELILSRYQTSVNSRIEQSINGYGFETARIHCKKPFSEINFSAEFKIQKQELNPYAFEDSQDVESDYKLLDTLKFRSDHESFLKTTELTKLDTNAKTLFVFDRSKSIFENLKTLHQWVYDFITFEADVTTVKTTLSEIIHLKKGVCQDFTHLYCALARTNGIPARYVSGYLHQGQGYSGDSQMHAWSEAYVPTIGWVGFDTTNNLLVNHNHIKVAHGKDYSDCPPIKGIVYSTGKNFTKYSVEVSQQQ